MKKFILGMVVATAIILLYIYRKRIFIAAQSPSQSNGNSLISAKSSVTSKALPQTEGALVGKLISDMMDLKAKEERPGSAADSIFSDKPAYKNPNNNTFDIGKMVINRAIEYPKSVAYCSCGCPMHSGCGCPDQYDLQ